MIQECINKLESYFVNSQTINNNPKLTEKLIKESISFANQSLSGENQWKVINLSQKIAESLEQDLTLNIGNQCVKTNSQFLISLSPFFEAMFCHQLKETVAFKSRQPVEIKANDILADLLKGSFPNGNIVKILEIANMYALLPLTYPVLKELELHIYDDETIKTILGLLPEDIQLLNLSHLDSKGFVDLKRFPELRRFKSLKTLYCHGCENAVYHASLKKTFPNLEELDISDCPKLSTLPQMSELKKLNIINCPNLKMESVESFLMKHSDLSTLEVSHPNTQQFNQLIERVKTRRDFQANAEPHQ